MVFKGTSSPAVMKDGITGPYVPAFWIFPECNMPDEALSFLGRGILFNKVHPRDDRAGLVTKRWLVNLSSFRYEHTGSTTSGCLFAMLANHLGNKARLLKSKWPLFSS